MGETDHKVAAFFLTEQGNHLLGCGDGVEKGHPRIVGLLYQSFRLRTEAEHSDTAAIALQHHIAFYQSMERRVREVVVGADHGKLRHAH